MNSLYLSDILKRVGLDITKVKLIRHSLNHKNFKDCYEAGFIKEYTQIQKKDFSEGYEYWITFISDKGTSAKLDACYKVNGFVLNTLNVAPKGFPRLEMFDGEHGYFDLMRTDILQDMSGRLIIDWGKATIQWCQKATNEKPVLAIQANHRMAFIGYENIVLSFNELKEILEDSITYDNWHTALSSVYAIYLITDKTNGKQYIGSAYGQGGLLSRWNCYVDTKHGNNKEMQELICDYPERYKDFQFSILQILPKTITDEEVIKLESLYKKKLLTKEFGMNEN